MEKIFNKVKEILVIALLFLLPISVLPISPNPYIVPKLYLAVIIVGLLLLIASVKTIVDGKLELRIGNYDFPIAFIAFAYILSAILKTPNKMEAILVPGTATAIVAGALIYFLLNQLKDGSKTKVEIALVSSAILYSVLSLFASVGIFAKIPQLPAIFKSVDFTPEGGYLPSAIFLISIIPIAIGILLSQKEIAKKALFGAASVFLTLTLGFYVYKMLPGKANYPKFPSINNTWSITVDSLKESAVLGIGPGNYLTAFNRFRPISYNSTDIWALKFTTGSNFYFTAFTETGLLGLIGIMFLIFALYKSAKKDFKEKKLVNWGFSGIADLISLLIMLLIIALFPTTNFIIMLIFVLFALNSQTHQSKLDLTTTSGDGNQASQKVISKFPAVLITTPIILIVIFSFYQGTRMLIAEYKFNSAINALTKNDAQNTYTNIVDAIKLNNRVDRYHSAFAQVNLLFANAIAQKKDIADQDKTNITTLIQQAIQEGKAAVALNPSRSGNWFSLGRTYQTIIPLAKGADTFAAQSYAQAIALDPINPTIRVALGGLYYANQDFETASRVLELAVRTKADLANSHYNLAFAYRDMNKLDLAIQEMTVVLSLVDKKTNDYEVARKSLEDMQNKKKGLAGSGEQLTPPQKQEAILKPPIELPEGSEPPAGPSAVAPAQENPTASPTLQP